MPSRTVCSRIPRRALCLCLALLLIALSRAHAERVKAIRKGGVLELDTGKRVILAGIESAPESLRLLRVLLADKEVELEYERDLPPHEASGAMPAYLFVTTSEVRLPLEAKTEPDKKRVMVNQLLLATGAARVDARAPFKWKSRFSKIEDEARRKGEGIWSYEEP